MQCLVVVALWRYIVQCFLPGPTTQRLRLGYQVEHPKAPKAELAKFLESKFLDLLHLGDRPQVPINFANA